MKYRYESVCKRKYSMYSCFTSWRMVSKNMTLQHRTTYPQAHSYRMRTPPMIPWRMDWMSKWYTTIQVPLKRSDCKCDKRYIFQNRKKEYHRLYMISRREFTRDIISKLSDEQKVYLVKLTKRVFPDAQTNSRIRIQGSVILRCIYGYPDKYESILSRLKPDDHLFLKHNLSESLNWQGWV